MIQATRADAYKLLHQGALTLATVENNGVRIDTDYLNRTINKFSTKISQLQSELKQDEVFKVWKKTWKEKTQLGSLQQLTKVLFDVMEIKYRGSRTATGRYQATEEVIASVGIPFTEKYGKLRKLQHAKGTFLTGLQRETIDGFFHPNFNLHSTQTYRSSSGSDKDDDKSTRELNFQNLPRRDPYIGKIIRKCFIPRKGRVLIEIDFKAHEWVIACSKWKDPSMLTYTKSGADPHKDFASWIFACDVNQVHKSMRDVAKNQFTFPVLYGSFYVQIAQRIWEDIRKRKLELVDGTSVLEHLKSKGIKKLGECDTREEPRPGTFEHHCKEVERKFAKKFATFWQGKDAWYNAYRERGYFDMMTGFRCTGLYSKNDLLNWDVQGPAFHCLLQLIIEAQQRITNTKMRTLLLGQVHDSLLSCVPDSEVQDYLDMCQDIISNHLPKIYPWIIVPLGMEAQVAKLNWYDKVPWVKIDDEWKPEMKKAA